MTTPRPRLTREQAFATLTQAGFPTGTFTTNLGKQVPFNVLMVGIGAAESDLIIDAQGPPNRDGSIDRGWVQINSIHGYDDALLLSDPVYTAKAALQILLTQGVRAWAAYGHKGLAAEYPYARRMPPGMGGPDLTIGSRGALVVSLQQFLNRQREVEPALGYTRLVADGVYGRGTQAAVDKWKYRYHRDGLKPITDRTWAKMAAVGGLR